MCAERTTNAGVFEALSSLRGDVANESVQHAEFAAAISKDVLEPLTRLKDGADAVARISAEAKHVTRDAKAAFDRCRKVFEKYIKAYKRAAELSVAAGLEAPTLWLPPECEHLRSRIGEPHNGVQSASTRSIPPRANAVVPTASQAKVVPQALLSASVPATERLASPSLSSTRSMVNPFPILPSTAIMPPVSHLDSKRVDASSGSGGASAQPTTSASTSLTIAASDEVPAEAHGNKGSPISGFNIADASAVSDSASGSDSAVSVKEHTALVEAPTVAAVDVSSATTARVAEPSTTDHALSQLSGALNSTTSGTPLPPFSTDVPPSPAAEVALSQSISASHLPLVVCEAAGISATGADVSSAFASRQAPLGGPSSLALPLSTTAAAPVAPRVSQGLESMTSAARGSSRGLPPMPQRVAGDPALISTRRVGAPLPVQPPLLVRPTALHAANATSGGLGGTNVTADARAHTVRSSQQRGDDSDDDAASIASGGTTGTTGTESLSLALAGRMKALGTTMFNLSALVGTPAYIGPATQTTADRIAAMRATAVVAVDSAHALAVECAAAWDAHAHAKNAFSSVVTAAVAVFTELEKRRVSEICDVLRRYAVFGSSMLANLQYDVNKLAERLEANGLIAASAAPALSAPMIGRATMRMDASLNALTGTAIASIVNSGGTAAARAPASLRKVVPHQPLGQRATGSVNTLVQEQPPPVSHAADRSPLAAAPITFEEGGPSDEEQLEDDQFSHGDAGSDDDVDGDGSTVRRHPASPVLTQSCRAESAPSVPNDDLDAPNKVAHAVSVPGIVGVAAKPVVAAQVASSAAATMTGFFAALTPQTAAASPIGKGGHVHATAAVASPQAPASPFARFFSFGGVSAPKATTALATAAVVPQRHPHGLSPLVPKSSTPAGVLAPRGVAASGSAITAHTSQADAATTATRHSSPPAAPKNATSTVPGTTSLGAAASSIRTRSSSDISAPASATASPAGSIELLVNALFDDAGGRVRSSDVATALGYPHASAAANVTTAAPVLSLSLADFATGSGALAAESLVQAPPLTTEERTASGVALSATPQPPASCARGDLNSVVLALLPAVLAELSASPMDASSGQALSRFVAALDRRRGEGTVMSRPALDALTLAAVAALDNAVARSDYACARTLMVMSQTFFTSDATGQHAGSTDGTLALDADVVKVAPRELVERVQRRFTQLDAPECASAAPRISGNHNGTNVSPISDKGSPSSRQSTGRQYLQTRLLGHPLWQDSKFWESSVYDSLGAEMTKAEDAAKMAGGSRKCVSL